LMMCAPVLTQMFMVHTSALSCSPFLDRPAGC
jgi:hypothetical protein